VDLEKAGVPSLIVTTTAFNVLAKMEATAFGLPNVQILTVPHPLGAGQTLAMVQAKAEKAVESLVKMITRQDLQGEK
jgi:hypothetical protein